MILRLHPLHRLLISAVTSAITYLLVRNSNMNRLQIPMVMWDIFALTLIVTSWIVILLRPTEEIRKWARKEDGSKAFVFTLVLLTSLASMVTVVLLITSKEALEASAFLYVTLALLGILLSWITVHTLFTFHYAHLFYDDDDDEKSGGDAGGLEFPEKREPDYLDFAYFAFVIGMTFQVSDVQVTDKRMRRAVLGHGLLSFALNTFVVALTINLISGLKG